LGSGFRLAAKDLEIRGAGNFLGSKQHGYMESVGFEYYMHLLEQTVKRLKGEGEDGIKSEIHLKIDVQIPEDYLPQMSLRLNLYKRISSVEDIGELDRIREEVQDRFGNLPPSLENLLGYGAVKFLAQVLRIKSLNRVGRQIVFDFSPSSTVDLDRLTRFLESHNGSITPQGTISLPLRAGNDGGLLDETIAALKELSFM